MKKIIVLSLSSVLIAASAGFSACGGGQSDNRSHYNIEASYDADARTLTATCAFSFYNDTENEITDLKFNLYGNAYREGATYSPVSENYRAKAYYNGDSYGSMTVTAVDGCKSWQVGGGDENILTVNLTQSAYPEERAEISISYTLTLAEVNHRTGVTEHTVNLGNFYPILCYYGKQGYEEHPYYDCGDPFLSACADYSVTIDTPSDCVCAAGGRQEDVSEANGRKKYVYSLSNARDFAAVLSTEFDVTSVQSDGVTINYYYYDDGDPQKISDAVSGSEKYFSSTFGQYEYPVLNVVQTGFCYGGMEYPALVMISDSLGSDDAVYTAVHETAHQWWYAMVGSDQIGDAWQDEGLAEYSALMFFENNPSYGYTRAGMVGSATKAYRAYFSVYNQIFGNADTSMSRGLDAFSGEYEYANIAYNKGLILFDTLRSSIGDDKFTAALKRYFTSFSGKVATSGDITACFEAQGVDLTGFFAGFLDGKILI